MKHTSKSLLVFLIQNVHEIKEDTKFLDKVLEQILAFRDHHQIEVVLCLSTSNLPYTLTRNLDRHPETTDSPHSIILRLRPRSQPSNGKRFELLTSLPFSKADFCKTNNVTAIFRFIQERFYYKYIILSTWDHGSGYAIFSEPDKQKGRPSRSVTPEAPPPIKRSHFATCHPNRFAGKHRLFKLKALREGYPQLVHDKLLTRFRAKLKNLSWLTPPNGLTMDSLKLAIQRSFGTVDIIFMRNCYMQIFDTGYTLHPVTKYLIASEGSMDFRAYDYDIWLDAIEKMNGRISLPQIAQAIIAGFSQSGAIRSIADDTAMFGNNLDYYPALNTCMNAMIRILIQLALTHKAELLECRREITDLTREDYPTARFHLVDARLWFEKAGELLQRNKTYHEHLRTFKTLHKKTVGNRSYRGNVVGYGNCAASGFSLYFPALLTQLAANRSYYELYYALSSRYKSRFTKRSLWDDFIAALFLRQQVH